jgi:MFS family permease
VAAGQRNRNLWLVQTSWSCWVATDLALLVTLSVVAFSLDGVGAVGLVAAARVLPGAVLGPLLATAADRLPRPLLLAGLHLGWAAASLALAWAATAQSLWAVVAVAAAGSLGGSLFKSGLRALMSQVVRTPAELVTANATYAALEGVGTVVGPVLAGLLLSALTPAAALASLSVIFVVGAVASAAVRTAFQVPRRTAPLGLRDAGRGFAELLKPQLRGMFAVFMAQSTMRGLLTVFVAALCLRSGGGGEERVAGLFAAMGVGGLVGAAVAARLPGQGGAARRATLAVVLWGLPIALLGLWPADWMAWGAMAVVGLGNAIEDVYGFTALDRLLPNHVAARAYAAFWSLAAGLATLGSLAGPPLVTLLGLGPTMATTGAALAGFALLMVRPLGRVDARVAAGPVHLGLVQAVPEFAPLPAMALERLATAVVPRSLVDGDVVVREGDEADGFAIVVSGTLDVQQGGRSVRELGPGDAFGEIGLLMARPRTASVVSAGPAQILWLDAETFIAAVTGHRHASAVAMVVAGDRLASDRSRDDPRHTVEP